MSVQPQPTSNATVFNSSFYVNSNSTYLTESLANTLYLQLENGGTVQGSTVFDANVYSEANLILGSSTPLIVSPYSLVSNLGNLYASNTFVLSGGTYLVPNANTLIQIMNYPTTSTWTNAPANLWASAFLQVGNIDLTSYQGSCVPIGNSSVAYSNVTGYNGGGYWINNWLYYNTGANNVGLFGNISNSTISNITITGNLHAVGGNSNVGALIGIVNGTTSNINNCNLCVTNGNLKAAQGNLGGLIGLLINCSACYNLYSNASIIDWTVREWTGGIIGNANACSSNIANLVNAQTGPIFCTLNEAEGGVIGRCNTTAVNLYNYMVGNIMGGAFVGGIVGNLSAGSLYDCVNAMRGDIDSPVSTGGSCGGVIGQWNNGSASSVIGCHNCMTGNVNSSNVNAVYGSGGIISFITGGGAKTLTNCINSMNGNIISIKDTGGIFAGWYGGNLTMTNCLVAMNGNITSSSTANAGGLIGLVDTNANLFGSNCIVSGNVNIIATGSGSANLNYNKEASLTDNTTGYGYRTTYGLQLSSVAPTANLANIATQLIASSSSPYIVYASTSSPYSDFPLMWNANTSTNMMIEFFCANANASYSGTSNVTSNIILTQNPLVSPFFLPEIAQANGVQWFQNVNNVLYAYSGSSSVNAPYANSNILPTTVLNQTNSLVAYANMVNNELSFQTSMAGFSFSNSVAIAGNVVSTGNGNFTNVNSTGNVISTGNFSCGGNFSVSGVFSASNYRGNFITNSYLQLNSVAIPIANLSNIANLWQQSGSNYIVSSPQHFVQLMSNSTSWSGSPANPWSASYLQTANIDLTNYAPNITPIGNTASQFSGGYNGNGYWINNWSLSAATSNNVAIFGNINGANLSNITLTGTMNVTGNNNVALLCAQCGSIGDNFSNITIVTTGNLNANTSVAPLIGYAAQMGNCSNITITVTGNIWANGFGGCAGGCMGNVFQMHSGATCQNFLLNNTGNIVANNNSCVGGFVGQLGESPNQGSFNPIKNVCVNHTGMLNSAGSCGGLTGTMSAAGGQTTQLEDIVINVIGNIYGTNQAGGLTGLDQNSSNTFGISISVQGNIISNSGYAGGITAQYGGSGGTRRLGQVIVSMNGDIKAFGGAGYDAGGVCGSMNNNNSPIWSNILIMNQGNILAYSGGNAGGLIGYINSAVSNTITLSNIVVSGNCNIACPNGGGTGYVILGSYGATFSNTAVNYNTSYGLKVNGSAPTANTSNVSVTIPANGSSPYIVYQGTAEPYCDFPSMWMSNTSNYFFNQYFCMAGNATYPNVSQYILTQNVIYSPYYFPSISNVNGIQEIVVIPTAGANLVYSNQLAGNTYYSNLASVQANSLTPNFTLTSNSSSILFTTALSSGYSFGASNVTTTGTLTTTTLTVNGNSLFTGSANIELDAIMQGNANISANLLVNGNANINAMNFNNLGVWVGGTSGSPSTEPGTNPYNIATLADNGSTYTYFTLDTGGTSAAKPWKGVVISLCSLSSHTLTITPTSNSTINGSGSVAVTLSANTLHTLACYSYNGVSYVTGWMFS